MNADEQLRVRRRQVLRDYGAKVSASSGKTPVAKRAGHQLCP